MNGEGEPRPPAPCATCLPRSRCPGPAPTRSARERTRVPPARTCPPARCPGPTGALPPVPGHPLAGRPQLLWPFPSPFAWSGTRAAWRTGGPPPRPTVRRVTPGGPLLPRPRPRATAALTARRRYLVSRHRSEALEDGQDVLLAGVPHCHPGAPRPASPGQRRAAVAFLEEAEGAGLCVRAEGPAPPTTGTHAQFSLSVCGGPRSSSRR